jgi:hypothetical protein
MTDPNYWLAAWLVLTSVIFFALFLTGINDDDLEHKNRALGLCFICWFINLIAALYCAGFVVVMP